MSFFLSRFLYTGKKGLLHIHFYTFAFFNTLMLRIADILLFLRENVCFYYVEVVFKGLQKLQIPCYTGTFKVFMLLRSYSYAGEIHTLGSPRPKENR